MTENTMSDPTSPLAYPFKRTCPFSISPRYEDVAPEDALGKVEFSGKPAWLVTGYEDVRRVLGDSRMSVRGTGDTSRGEGDGEAPPGFFLSMDPPQHDDLRRTLVDAFTPRRVQSLRPAIECITNELIDAMVSAGGPVDLIEAMAIPLPSLVICELLGVPYDDHEFFQEHTRTNMASESTPEQTGAAVQAVIEYLGELTARKQAEPGDDLISRLIQGASSGSVTLQEVAGMASLLLIAGHETTGNVIALGVYTLLTRPELAAQLIDDPDLMPQAVEEMLRTFDIIGNLPRSATEDMNIAGQTIRKGEMVLLATEAANRDSRVYVDPDKLDINRPPVRHLAFGHGIHVCIGAPLARLELQIVFATLLKRLPGLRLAESESAISFKSDNRIFGIHRLPVTW